MSITEGSEAALFVQENPAGVPEPLTCVGIDNITIPKGDRTIVYCPSGVSGQFTAEGFIKGEAGPVTIPLTRPLDTVRNYLLETTCAGAYRVNWSCPETNRYLVTNYLVGITVFGGEFTEGAIEAPQALQPDANGRVNTTGQISGLSAQFIYLLQSIRQSLSQTQHVNCIDFLPKSCGTKCGVYRGLCQEGYAVLDTDYLGLYGDTVIYTDDGGAAWTATATGPFTWLGRNATCVKTIVTAAGHRVIVSGGAVPGAPPEIAYSDDIGVNWINVNPETVGAANRGVNKMTWDKRLRLWAVADDGRIYVTANIGTTWTVSEDGTETAQDLNDIAFVSDTVGYAVGDSNVVLKTTDGDTWDSLVGPAVGVNMLTVDTNRSGHVFVGTNDARVFRSTDGGITWEEIIDLNTGSIDILRFDPDNEYIGYFAWNNGTPQGTVYRTEDGGASWVAGEIGLTTPVNNGIYTIAICDANEFFVGGNVVTGTSYIAKFSRKSSTV